ncbi:SDR family NAD(P)-dependent oxidoreductase [Spirillospora sp. NPDC052269]
MDVGDLFWRTTWECTPRRQFHRLRRPRSLRSVVAGKRVVLTGASSGIGRETALLLGNAGAEVVLVARRAHRLAQVAEGIDGASVHVCPCDLTDPDQTARLTTQILEMGGADLLINNAGHSIRRALANSRDPFNDIERQVRLNFLGALRLTLPLLADMRARGGGHIVNVSTFGTQIGALPHFAGYLASKAAFEAFARSTAPETRGDGVRWTIINMPLVRTDMSARGGINQNSAMSARSAARVIAHAVVHRPARISHPVGLAARLSDLLFPRTMERVMSRSVDPVRNRQVPLAGGAAGAGLQPARPSRDGSG